MCGAEQETEPAGRQRRRRKRSRSSVWQGQPRFDDSALEGDLPPRSVIDPLRPQYILPLNPHGLTNRLNLLLCPTLVLDKPRCSQRQSPRRPIPLNLNKSHTALLRDDVGLSTGKDFSSRGRRGGKVVQPGLTTPQCRVSRKGQLAKGRKDPKSVVCLSIAGRKDESRL